MVQRRPPLPRRLRALCAVLPAAGLLVPLAAAPAVPATLRGAGVQRPSGPDPAVPGHLTTAAGSESACDPGGGPPCTGAEGGGDDRTAYGPSAPNASGDAVSYRVTVPPPPPSASPAPDLSGTPQPVPGSGAGGRLPETGSAGALPLIGLAALGCLLAGLMALATRTRRRR
ncbi:hypothetical protein HUT16_21515 [Kitasatospora sp. NA04385]|uniref:hypothetical protein n=1 Tax=Kitasatospora sp. NA04385 TaxID=2742135 RepID=UPI00158FDF7D|nr:hypothetical protein [Kitasatospora sp. NA04385]QKW21292.1 hypothetical protein HUT16_21515 [Kitasatospora sp. NA04385]